jgi:hypothetical protein
MKVEIKKISKKVFLMVFLATSSFVGNAQVLDPNQQTVDWLENIYQHGVVSNEDSILVQGETARILNEPDYKNFMYPKEYTWPVAMKLIQMQQLKPAFWYFLNLYLVNDQNKELVVRSILAYNKFLKMDKALVGAFYTYSLTDPEVGSFVNGKQQITAPHILERKLQALKELLYYLDKFKDPEKLKSDELTQKNN